MYTAFAGPFVYALLGSVRQITVGPTAVMAIMTHEYAVKGGAPYAIVLSFLAGCIELMAGLLNLGKKARLDLLIQPSPKKEFAF